MNDLQLTGIQSQRPYPNNIIRVNSRSRRDPRHSRAILTSAHSLPFLLLLLTAFFFISNARSQELIPQPVIPGQWLRSWLLCGPIPIKSAVDTTGFTSHLAGFTTDYLAKSGGEQNLSVKAGDVVKLAKGKAQWKLFNSPDSIIDLDKALSKEAPVLGYAYTEILSDRDKVWIISIGTNDGGSLWVNGLKVWDYQQGRGLSIDDDQIPVLLKAGTNSLLLKVEERGNSWKFCVRLLPFSTRDLAGNSAFFRISTLQDGGVAVASDFTSVVMDQLIKSIDIQIVNNLGNTVFKELRNSGFCNKIDLKPSGYQHYQSLVDIKLKSGENIHTDNSFFAGDRKNYTLFSNGKSDYRISLDAQASESEKWAASELQQWLKKISGVELPIDQLGTLYKGPQIIIGYNEFVRDKTGEKAPADLDESFRYCNSEANILIYGGKARGSMYGVIAFLENELGCRWYTPSVSVIPQRNEFAFSWFDHAEKPGVRVRNDFYYEAFDPIWAARNRMNGTMAFHVQPGGVESYWAVHTFYPLLPPSEFFSKHPEYYSLIDGKRVKEQAQLCLTNPEVLKIMIDRIRSRMRESPEYLIYDVSQNDCYNPCECDKCQAIVKQEGGESGLMIWFVNQVAEAIEKEFPDKFIGTLAYQYTRTPPKSIRPRNNVVVRLCSIECCFAHDFKSCPQNKSFLDDLKKWSALAPHLYIWDYVVNFSHYVMPYPNFKVLQSNIQTFRENNSIGIMEQAAYQSRGGEFSELRSYLLSRLLWNPDADPEPVINDFMYGYYGRSGKFVRQYFDLLHSRITPETHIHLGLSPDDPIFSDDFVKESCRIFEEACKVADNDEILKRVEMASLPVLYLKCKRTPVLAKYDGTYSRFSEIAKREGVTYYAESGESHRAAFHREVEGAK
jgi:hypothetical protein